MTKDNNLKPLVANKKPSETVYELKDYQVKKSPLSPAARGKVVNKSGSNYLSEKDGYGPCKYSLCGCSCSSYSCSCESASIRLGELGTSFSVSGRGWESEPDLIEKEWNETAILMRATGVKERGAGGQISGSAFGYKDSGGEIKVLSGTASSEVDKNGIRVRASADVLNIKTEGVQVRAGIAVDTGVSLENGLEAKVAGFGLTLGKQVGVSLPFGEVKVDTEDCVIQ